MLPYREREYSCRRCGYHGPHWTVEQQAPPEFLLQPHNLYPMTQAAFDHWAAILIEHFPEHPAIARLGATFLPRLPEEVEAMRAARHRAYPVEHMTDQDGARRLEPDLRVADEWLEIMRPGGSLVFQRRDGGTLALHREASGHRARCCDAAGVVLAEGAEVDDRQVRDAVHGYLLGDTAATVRCLRQPRGLLERLWYQIIDPA